MYENGNSFAEGYMIGRDSYNNNSGFGWGNDSAWWIIILLIFGWGGNNGFGGGFGGFGGNNMAFDLGRLATTTDVASGFNNSAVLSSLNDLKLGQAGLQQTLCQGFNGINTSVLQGFHGVDNAICTLGYQNQQGFNALSREIGDCCCKIERGIDGINYNNQRNTCEIIQAGNANTQRLVDLINEKETQKLRDENFSLKLGASQERQNNYLINTLRPVAQPAYITCSPYESAFGCNRGGCGYNNCAVVQ